MTLDEAKAWEATISRMSHNPRRKRASRIPVEGRVTKREVRDMLQSQDFRCAVTGVHLIPFEAGEPKPFQPSLDRIENDEGYALHNVRIVALIVNVAMNRWGEQPLFELFRQQTAVAPTSD